MALILLGTLMLVIIVGVATDVAVRELPELVSKEAPLTMIIGTLFAFMVILIGADNHIQEYKYKAFRDKSYHDYSKDRNYQKWLIDNPKDK